VLWVHRSRTCGVAPEIPVLKYLTASHGFPCHLPVVSVRLVVRKRVRLWASCLASYRSRDTSPQNPLRSLTSALIAAASTACGTREPRQNPNERLSRSGRSLLPRSHGTTAWSGALRSGDRRQAERLRSHCAEDRWPGSGCEIRARVNVVQRKTGRPAQFGIAADARCGILAWLERLGRAFEDHAFPSRIDCSDHLGRPQYARAVDELVGAVGLRVSKDATHRSAGPRPRSSPKRLAICERFRSRRATPGSEPRFAT